MNNYHTHTYRCHHAEGDVSDYAEEAVKAGIEILGFSDHTPLPDGRWTHVRMSMDELEGYLEAVDNAAEKYGGSGEENFETTDPVLNEIPENQGTSGKQLTVLKGLECDWDVPYRNFYIEELLGKHRLDYLIGAVHFFPYRGEWLPLSAAETPSHLNAYADHLIRAMEQKYFSFIAHPDSFGIGYIEWDENAEACSKDILSAAEELGVILEINGYGLRKPEVETSAGLRKKYPLLPFWETASDYNIKVICNSDAHKPADTAASIDETKEIAGMFDLEVTEELLLKEQSFN